MSLPESLGRKPYGPDGYWVVCPVLLIACIFATGDKLWAVEPAELYRPVSEVRVRGERAAHQLRTFCQDAQGNLFAVVAPTRPAGNLRPENRNNTSEIRVLDHQLQPVRQWSVDFSVQAIDVSHDGLVYVSGNGRLAKFDVEGHLLQDGDLPFIQPLVADLAAIRAHAKAFRDDQIRQFEDRGQALENQIDQRKAIVKELQELMDSKTKGSVTTAERRKLHDAEGNLHDSEKRLAVLRRQNVEQDVPSVDEFTAQTIQRLKTTYAISVTDHDVLIAAAELKENSYSIWRVSDDLSEYRPIVAGLLANFGQIDLCSDQDVIYVAENLRRCVTRFDREGKKLGEIGNADPPDSSESVFRSPCNPMNLCLTPRGTVLAIETEGDIHEFTQEGVFKGLLGQLKVGGASKHLALKMSKDESRLFVLDQQKSSIIVLTKTSQPSATISK